MTSLSKLHNESMTLNAQLDLDFCLRQLSSLSSQKDRSWKEVRDRALLAKIAINKALGIGNIYSLWINRILCDTSLKNEETIDPAVTLRLVNLVDAAVRTYEDHLKGEMANPSLA